jgi:hypothetical protein
VQPLAAAPLEVLEAQAGSNPGLPCVGEDTSVAARCTVAAGTTAAAAGLLLERLLLG